MLNSSETKAAVRPAGGRLRSEPAPLGASRAAEPAGPPPSAWEPSRKPITKHRPDLAARLAALFYVATFGAALWIFLGCLALCWRYRWPTLLLLPYLYYSFGPGSQASAEGDWPTPLRRWALWRALARYFDTPRLVKTAELDPSKPYVFCIHPHGVLSFSAWLAFCCDALGFDRLFPGVDVRVLTVRINFRTPGFREYLLLHGICDVSQRACLNLLEKGKSVVIAVGGAAESLLSRPGYNDLVLRRRKGFVKVALQTGASLVPVYCFGETDTYSTLTHLPPGSFYRKLQHYMQRSWGWTLPVYWGRGLFLPRGLLPYPVQLTTVIGKPIHVTRYSGDEDSAEFHALVDKYHGQYIEALQELYRQHKDLYGKGQEDLRIVE